MNGFPRWFARVSRVVCAGIFILGALSVRILCQEGPPRRVLEQARYGDVVFVDAAVLPSDSALFERIDVMVRIAKDFIVFTRSGVLQRDSSYVGGMEISIEIQDPKGGAVASTHDKTRIFTGSYESTNTRDEFLNYRKTFYLSSDTYTIKVILNDVGSTRERIIPVQVKLRSLDAPEPVIGSVIPLAPSALSDPLKLPVEILGFGNSVMYSRPAYVAVTSSDSSRGEWRFILQKTIDQEERKVVSDTVLEPLATYNHATLSADNGFSVTNSIIANPAARGYVHLFRLPYDTLFAGRYQLYVRVADGGMKDTLTVPLRVYWKDMPFSMRDMAFAASVMRYIETEDEMKAMDGASQQRREELFQQFWKKRDPTPGTALNERMTEYFRRADVAETRFQTLFNRHGALSDRGKIYILYGEPDDVRHTMQPDEPPAEIWVYRDLNQSFRFADRDRNGNMRLAQ